MISKTAEIFLTDRLPFELVNVEQPAPHARRGHADMDMRAVYAAKSSTYKMVKRGFDIMAALMALILLSPVFLLTALAIKIFDGGSVIFTQRRTGVDGKPFMMYKFRSMVPEAGMMRFNLIQYNELQGPAFKMKNDPRITRVGHFIRRTSIDELPQLVNILKGEMSFVGPRPIPFYEYDQCDEYQQQRFMVTPGLTCFWQVSGRCRVSYDERIEMDLDYIEKMSVMTDLKLILRTFGAVVRMTGAY